MSKLIKRKKKGTQINITINDKENITTSTNKHKSIIKENLKTSAFLI